MSFRTTGLKLVPVLLLAAFLLWPGMMGFAGNQEETTVSPADSSSARELTTPEKEEKFNPGEMIMEHVVDNHEWHILSIGSLHLTLPLPVILIYNGKIYTFWSSAFHNENRTHMDFILPEKGPNRGKIVTVEEEMTGKKGNSVYDFSITKTVLAIFISGFLLILIFTSVAKRYASRKNQAPTGLQNVMEPLILFVRDDIAKSSIGPTYEKYMPYLLTIFFFIFFNNVLGIIPIFPGGANVTGNIAVTGVMALCTLIITSFTGTRAYWLHMVNTPGVPWWLKLPIPLMPIVEIIGVITKPFVLMVRLFANITAGHIIILGFISIIFIFGQISTALGLGVGVPTVAFMVFMDLLELLVAFIQAYVFTLLSALYFGLAMVEDHH
jgi:F-type H+-transporting ATPase subunit a